MSLPLELQDEIFEIAARDLFRSCQDRSLLNIALVDRRRFERAYKILRSICAPNFELLIADTSFPPESDLGDSRQTADVRHLALSTIKSCSAAERLSANPPDSPTIWRSDIVRHARQWPVKTMWIVVRPEETLRSLFSPQSDLESHPPFQSCLTHISLIFSYGPFDALSDWVDCCHPSIAQKITHLNICWTGYPTDAVDGIAYFLERFSALKVFAIGFYIPLEDEVLEILPVDPRIAIYEIQELHDLYFVFAWDWEEHARGKENGFWQRAEQFARQRLPYLQQFRKGWWNPERPRFIAKVLLHCAVPSVLTYICLSLCIRTLEISLRHDIVVFLAVISRPLHFFAHSLYWRPYVDGRKAKELGAVLPPVLPGFMINIGLKAIASLKESYPGDIFHVWMKKYGYIYQIPTPHNITLLTFEPEHIKIMLATQFEKFEKGDEVKESMKSLFGFGIFNVDGDLWKFHRSLTRPFFNKDRISDFDIYERNVQRTIQVARDRIREGHSLDMQDLVGRYTLESATEFLFGANMQSFEGNIPYPPSFQQNMQSAGTHVVNSDQVPPRLDFITALDTAVKFTVHRSVCGALWPLVAGDFWKDRVAPLRKVLDSYIEPLLDASLKAHSERESLEGPHKGEDLDIEEYPTVLSYLVARTQDKKLIKDEILNLFVAGRDTTSSFLTMCFYMLCEHPEVEKRLRAEMLQVVGHNQRPTLEKMREMKYTRAFLNEVLRLYPPVPLEYRQCKEAVVFPKTATTPATYIPKGAACTYPVIYLQRRTDLWGPDALKFDPDRFIDERLHKYLVPNPFIFVPFHAGPRICLGQQFAYHKATYFLIRFMQAFQNFSLDMKEILPPPELWKKHPGLQATEKVTLRYIMNTFVVGGLWMKVQEWDGPDNVES